MRILKPSPKAAKRRFKIIGFQRSIMKKVSSKQKKASKKTVEQPTQPATVKKADNTMLYAGAIGVVAVLAILFWLNAPAPQAVPTPTPLPFVPSIEAVAQQPSSTPEPVPTIEVQPIEVTASPTPAGVETAVKPTIQPLGAHCNNDLDCAQGWCDKTIQTNPAYWGTCVTATS